MEVAIEQFSRITADHDSENSKGNGIAVREPMAGDYESTIVEALQHLRKAFRKNELAFLALTSKPEFAFRDRLAFVLHRQPRRNRITVAREWRRIDLALLTGDEPQVLIQLKAWSLFTFITEAKAHIRKLKQDIKKCDGFDNNPKVYSLIVATQIDGDSLPDKSFMGAVKYLDRWRKARRDYGSSTQIEESAKKMVRMALKGWRVVDNMKIPAGNAFGASVSVHYWLCEPR